MLNRIRDSLLSTRALSLVVLLLGSGFFLASCATEEVDRGAPEISLNLSELDGKYRFGVTDTVLIEFSEPIDTAALAVEFLPTIGSDGISKFFQGDRKLLIHGAHKNFGRTHFEIGKSFAIVLSHLTDLAGNRRGQIQLDFAPYTWSDVDFFDRDREDEVDTLFGTSSRWRLPIDAGDTLWTEGKLDGLTQRSPLDLRDAKLIRLLPMDTLSVLLDGPRAMNIKLELLGPYPEASFDSLFYDTNPKLAIQVDSTRNLGRAQFNGFVPGLARHRAELGVGNAEAPGLYVIRLNMFQQLAGFYRLRVVLKRESH